MASIINATTTNGLAVTPDNSGELRLQTNNGTTAITIDTSQNVGIGTSSPASKLDVYGAINVRSGYNVQWGTDANYIAANTSLMQFGVNGSERMRITSAGLVGIGTSSPSQPLDVVVSGTGDQTIIGLRTTGGGGQGMLLGVNTTNTVTTIKNNTGSGYGMAFYSGGGSTEHMRITSNGTLLVGTTNTDPTGNNVGGLAITDAGNILRVSGDGTPALRVNRKTSDGSLVSFLQDGTEEGNISVSGTTVSYNGGHLSRWAQTLTPKDESLVKGTVLSNLDEMNEYVRPTTYWTEEDELPEGVNVGDVKEESKVIDNEQLNKVKVSDVEGDVNVAGVFVNWSHDEQHNVDEINMAMTGDMIIRIAEGVVVQKGDLLMSAGDGTAKPQSDDIVRSKTIAKVTSNHVTCTYEDGSYCVPCVLMAC